MFTATSLRFFASLFTALFLFSAALNSQADSPVWKVSKNGKHLYIGGTIHVLSQSDYPLPKQFDEAYKKSQLLVLEADTEEAQTPAFQQMVFQKAAYSDGSKITDRLDENIAAELTEFMQTRGLPLEPMMRFKPGMLTVTMSLVELQRLGLMGTGVDEFYNLKARNDGREVLFLESVEQQLNLIAEMGIGQENEFIRYTLDDLNDLPKKFGAMKDAWRKGALAEFEDVALDDLQNKFPNTYEALLVTRNNNWIPQIESMMATPEVELVLFGALHLVGEDGVIALLKDRGFKIEKL